MEETSSEEDQPVSNTGYEVPDSYEEDEPTSDMVTPADNPISDMATAADDPVSDMDTAVDDLQNLRLFSRLAATAPQLTPTPSSRFVYPVPSCHGKTFHQTCTSEKFYRHMEAHTEELYRLGRFTCDFGCIAGSADEFACQKHYLSVC